MIVMMLDYGWILIKFHLRRGEQWWRGCCWESPRSRLRCCSKWLRSGAPPRCRRCRCCSRTGSGRHVPPEGPHRPRRQNWPPTSLSPSCCDTARRPARCWAGRVLKAQQDRREERQLRWMAWLWTKVLGRLHYVLLHVWLHCAKISGPDSQSECVMLNEVCVWAHTEHINIFQHTLHFIWNLWHLFILRHLKHLQDALIRLNQWQNS